MKQYPKYQLPNSEGFKFVAIYENDEEVIQIVKTTSEGVHFTDNYNSIKSWRKLTNEEFDQERIQLK